MENPRQLETKVAKGFKLFHQVYPDATANLYPDIWQLPARRAPISSFEEARKRSEKRSRRKREKLSGSKVISLNQDKTLI